MPALRRLLPALLLTFLSGAAALAHETIWTRRLVDLLGASAETFSKVIGAFFLGVAAGAWLASRQTRPSRHPWRGVAWAEISVAFLAVPVLLAPAIGEMLFRSTPLSSLLKLLLPLALVAPPALAMGFVLPWMLRALGRTAESTGQEIVWLYAVNTLGGICGIAAVLLAPIPSLGLTRTGLLACAVNLLVGLLARILDQRNQQAPERRSPNQRVPGAELEPAGAEAGPPTVWLAAASGFLVLSLEVLLQHQLAQVTINSLFSGGMVLALVLGSLAISAALVPPLLKRFGFTGTLRAAWLGSAVLCGLQPFLLTRLRPNLAILPYELTALPYSIQVLQLGALVVMPVIVATGLIFPLLLRSGESGHRRPNARQVATLLAWNGVGGWLGTEMTQNFLAPTFGLWTSATVIGMAYLVLGMRCDLRFDSASPVARVRGGMIPLAAAAAMLLLCGLITRGLPQTTLLPGEKLAAVEVGREGVVATVACGPGDWRILFNNSYTLGGSKAQFNQERQGLLPLLLHGNPKSAAALGVATGGTVAGLALLPTLARVEAVELSPLVLNFARAYFAPFDRGVFDDPRIHFLQEDARWVMARNPASYDVIVGDLFLPWRTGESRLFTLEHFRNVRAALKPDGLFCQWLPLFQLTRQQFDAIARTFQEIFPDAFLVRGDFYCELPIVGLVGGRNFSQLDWPAIESMCNALRKRGTTTDPLVRHADGVAMMLLGPLPEPGPGPRNTLANAWLEWDAARNILGLREPWFIGVPCAEYVRGVQQHGAALLPESRRPAQAAGQFFLTLEIAAKIKAPETAGLENQIASRLPAALLNDTAADWRQWPSRVKPAGPTAGASLTTLSK